MSINYPHLSQSRTMPSFASCVAPDADLRAPFHSPQKSDAMQSRRVSHVVLSGVVDIPAAPARLMADWQREASVHLNLQPGNVEELPLARARARWPDYRRCVQAAADWLGALGMPDVLASSDVALMACRGASYHHDAVQYGSAAFCNLFLSEDRGLDLHFPATGQRIPLVRGTLVIFDTGQPHGVIARGSGGFDLADFRLDEDSLQVFLTWELSLGHAGVAGLLGIAGEAQAPASLRLSDGHLWLDGTPVSVCPESGNWCMLD